MHDDSQRIDGLTPQCKATASTSKWQSSPNISALDLKVACVCMARTDGRGAKNQGPYFLVHRIAPWAGHSTTRLISSLSAIVAIVANVNKTSSDTGIQGTRIVRDCLARMAESAR